MTSFSESVFSGVAQLLADAGIGEYSSSGLFAADAVAIVDKVLPASPDNAVALAQYPVSDSPSLSDSVIGLQVRTRAAGDDSRPVDEIADAIFDQLHGLADKTLAGGVRIVFSERRSGLAAAKDAQHRWDRTDNYYLTVWRPSLHRI